MSLITYITCITDVSVTKNFIIWQIIKNLEYLYYIFSNNLFNETFTSPFELFCELCSDESSSLKATRKCQQVTQHLQQCINFII